jgi:hypothetical protein
VCSKNGVAIDVGTLQSRRSARPSGLTSVRLAEDVDPLHPVGSELVRP